MKRWAFVVVGLLLVLSVHGREDEDAETDDAALAPAPAAVPEGQQVYPGGCTGPAPYDCGDAYDNGRNLGPRKCLKVNGYDVDTTNFCALATLMAGAEAEGVRIRIRSGFRTHRKQTELYNCMQCGCCNGGNTAAKPGWSNHQNGLAFDIDVDETFTSREYTWLLNNAHKYGFVRSVRDENWHWDHSPEKPACDSVITTSCYRKKCRPNSQGRVSFNYSATCKSFTGTRPAQTGDYSRYVDAGSRNVINSKCTFQGHQGTCMDVNSCTALTGTGVCPGSSNIRCCYGAESRSAEPPCIAFGKSGTCKPTSQCGPSVGQHFPNFCTGARDIRCCVPTAALASSADDASLTSSPADNAADGNSNANVPSADVDGGGADAPADGGSGGADSGPIDGPAASNVTDIVADITGQSPLPPIPAVPSPGGNPPSPPSPPSPAGPESQACEDAAGNDGVCVSPGTCRFEVRQGICNAVAGTQCCVRDVKSAPRLPNGTPILITMDQIMCAMPAGDRARIQTEFYAPINAALSNGQMLNARRIAAFVGVVARETQDLKFFKTTQCKDKYCGRGPLMISGAEWYKRATDDLDLDLETSPDLAENPVNGFRFASWFWTNKNYNKFANFKNFRGLCRQFGDVGQCLDSIRRALDCVKLKDNEVSK